MENQNNNPGKTIDNLENESVRGEEIKGGNGPVFIPPTSATSLNQPHLVDHVMPDLISPTPVDDGTRPDLVFGDDGSVPPIVPDVADAG